MFSRAKAILRDLISFFARDVTPKHWLSNQVQTVSDFQLYMLQSVVWVRGVHFDDLLCIDGHLFGRLEWHCDRDFWWQIRHDTDGVNNWLRVSLSGRVMHHYTIAVLLDRSRPTCGCTQRKDEAECGSIVTDYQFFGTGSGLHTITTQTRVEFNSCFAHRAVGGSQDPYLSPYESSDTSTAAGVRGFAGILRRLILDGLQSNDW